MYILAIETTGPHCSVAVTDENGKLQVNRSEATLNHLTRLVPMVQELLDGCGLRLSDMAAIAVSRGPGSFTGIRIGVSTARAFCQATGVPGIAVPTLQTLCYSMPDCPGTMAVMVDARRGQVYAGAYRWENGSLAEVVPGGPYEETEFRALVEKAAGGAEITYMEDGIQDAGLVAQMALEMYRKGELTGYGSLLPDYMRKSGAEQKLEAARAADGR